MYRLSGLLAVLWFVPSLAGAEASGTVRMEAGGASDVLKVVPGVPGENSSWAALDRLIIFSIEAVHPDGTRMHFGGTQIPGGYEGTFMVIDEPGHDRWFGGPETGLSLDGLRLEVQGDLLMIDGPIVGGVETGMGQAGRINGYIDAVLPLRQ